ncbi:hypothetical protein ACQ1Q5_04180 [Ornithobacterium rhinotracheale]
MNFILRLIDVFKEEPFGGSTVGFERNCQDKYFIEMYTPFFTSFKEKEEIILKVDDEKESVIFFKDSGDKIDSPDEMSSLLYGKFKFKHKKEYKLQVSHIYKEEVPFNTIDLYLIAAGF